MVTIDVAQHSKLPKISPVGDQAVNVEFGSEISDELNDRVYALVKTLVTRAPVWMRELVPTYRSLLVQYDGLEFDFETVSADLNEIVQSIDANFADEASRDRSVYELPTAYGGDHGPDIESVAEHSGLSIPEVIEIHSSTAYRVYMIGFSPGFPYLGGMDRKIATPRLSTPRTRVPAGSVGIAESQTGVYPTASPGGWRLIGRTPVRLFDVQRDPPSVLQPGQFVRFVPVEPDEFAHIANEVESGDYQIRVSELKP